MGFIFTFGGIFLGFTYVKMKEDNITQKKQFLELNNKNVNAHRVHVNECNINLEHLETQIRVQADLIITNKNRESIKTLIFSLNPNLKLDKISVNKQETTFEREQHLIKINLTQALTPNNQEQISFYYQGDINENIHSLDKNFDEYKDYFPMEMFKARKRFAYLQKDFVCLTSESLWYPISWGGLYIYIILPLLLDIMLTADAPVGRLRTRGRTERGPSISSNRLVVC